MNAASVDRCRELYELSRWYPSHQRWYYASDDSQVAPKYDLDYLLRQLKDAGIYAAAGYSPLENHATPGADTAVARAAGAWGSRTLLADTPENALCELVIELFRRNVLKRAAA